VILVILRNMETTQNNTKIESWNNNNYPWKIVDRRVYYSLIVIMVISILIFSLIILYLGYNNKFKSTLDCGTVNQTTDCGDVLVSECPEIPKCPNCPINVCECDCNFPDKIDIMIE